VKLTQDDCDRLTAEAEAAFGDLVPGGSPLTVEVADQLGVLCRILCNAPHHVIVGAFAGVLLTLHGKAAPLLARRLVETCGGAIPPDDP
jgi:hypothetical protein